jgi:fumarate hydratase subunit alpha
LNEDVSGALACAIERETYAPARDYLRVLKDNERVARDEQMPICQDTGMAVVFLDVGQDVGFVGGSISGAVERGVRDGYVGGLLRKSVVGDPIWRENTGDNTPAVLHVEIVPGDSVRVQVAPKGFGSANMSQIRMLTPSAGVSGVEDFIVETVQTAGANPCPPVVVGVGVGGTFEKCALLAKKALLRPIGEANHDPRYAEMESRLLERINSLGIGPGGFGGRTTALAVHIIPFATHIAGLPVAVNMCCHVLRHAEVTL